VGFLAREGALASVRAVLDRRRRHIEIGELEHALGRLTPPAPPPVQAVVSLQCLALDRASPPTGTTVVVDGDAIAVRELHVAQIRPPGGGPTDVYPALATLLAGPAAPRTRPPTAPELAGADFPLTRLEPLTDADPFAGERWPLDRAELVDVFPFERH